MIFKTLSLGGYAIVAKNFVILAKFLPFEKIYRNDSTIFMARGLRG